MSVEWPDGSVRAHNRDGAVCVEVWRDGRWVRIIAERPDRKFDTRVSPAGIDAAAEKETGR